VLGQQNQSTCRNKIEAGSLTTAMSRSNPEIAWSYALRGSLNNNDHPSLQRSLPRYPQTPRFFGVGLGQRLQRPWSLGVERQAVKHNNRQY
jgi:hypothetical protein